MNKAENETRVYLEEGKKRIIASALDWPGWCRGGRGEEEALEALIRVAPRYSAVTTGAGLTFSPPTAIAELVVVERWPGTATTDYGVPDNVRPADSEPMDEAALARDITVLRATWQAFDRAVEGARGKELTKGPRGGGRELEGIVRHVLDSEAGYASRVGLKLGGIEPDDKEAIGTRREAMLDHLRTIREVGVPPPGPRGGTRWSARYFIRRVAYHVVDHTWEIEDRAQ